MEKEFWGRRLATKVHGVEKQIDQTIRAAMDLLAEMQDAQDDANVSAVSTNATLAKVMEAMAHLQEARTDVTGAHRRLEQLGKDLGVRTTAEGPTKPVSYTEVEQDAEAGAPIYAAR